MSKRKYRFKSGIIGVLILSILMFSVPSFAESNDIKVFINGNQLYMDTQPQIINGWTLVPMRAILEKFGATINWDTSTKTVIATLDGNVVMLTVDSTIAYINGENKSIGISPITMDNRILIPLRFIAEGFGKNVDWDGNTKTITINDKVQPIPQENSQSNAINTNIPTDINSKIIINSIEALKFTIKQGTTFNLPPTVKAKMSDGNYEVFNVKWNKTYINTNIAGNYSYTGKVDGFNGDVVLNLTIEPKLKIIPITGVSGKEQLLKYLKENYSTLHTPVGEWILDYTILENSDDFLQFDYCIETDWNPIDGLTPYNLEYSNKISKEDRLKTMQMLTQLQKEIANVAIQALPNKRIMGKFYSGFYKYPTLKVGYESTSFLTWKNYDINANINGFQWDDSNDDYQFINETDENINILEQEKSFKKNIQIKEWNKSIEDTDGYDWVTLSNTQKNKLIQDNIKSIINGYTNSWSGNPQSRSIEWWITKIDKFYSEWEALKFFSVYEVATSHIY